MLPKDIFKKHQHIGIDLDETLANTFSGMLMVAHSMWKLLHCTSIEQFYVHDLYEDPSFLISKEEMYDIWHEYNLRTQKPEDVTVAEGAIYGVRRLMDTGIKCSIVTARSGNDALKKQITLNWVACYFPEITMDNIYFVNHYNEDALPKSVVCKNKGITLLIDDHMGNAHDMVGAGLSMILLEKPWNKNILDEYSQLYRVKNWQEIIDNLQ